MGPRVVAPPAKARPKVIRPPVRPALRPTLHGAGGGVGPLQPGRVEPQSLRPSLALPPGRVDPVSVEEVDKAKKEPTQVTQQTQMEQAQQDIQKDQKQVTQQTQMEQAQQDVQKDQKEHVTQQTQMEQAEQDVQMEQKEQVTQQTQMEQAQQDVQKDQKEHKDSSAQSGKEEKEEEKKDEGHIIPYLEHLQAVYANDLSDVEMADEVTSLRPKSAPHAPPGLRRCQEGAADRELQFLAPHWSDSETGYWAHRPETPDLPAASSLSMDSTTGDHDDPSLGPSRPSGYVPTRAPLSDTSPADVSPTSLISQATHR